MSKYVVDFKFEGTLSVLVEAENQSIADTKAHIAIEKLLDNEETLGVSVSSYKLEDIRRIANEYN